MAEEEEEAAGSLLVSKQEKLQWRVEAGRLGGKTQEMTGTEQLTAVTQKQNYTLHTLKEGVSFSTHLRVSPRDRRTFLIATCSAGQKNKNSKHSRMRVEKAPPV